MNEQQIKEVCSRLGILFASRSYGEVTTKPVTLDALCKLVGVVTSPSLLRMTETELMEEAELLAGSSKEELAIRHHKKFPAERPSVRGHYDPSRQQMLAELIVELATRYKGGES